MASKHEEGVVMRYDELLKRASRKCRLDFQYDGEGASVYSLAHLALNHLQKMLKSKLGLEPDHAVLYNFYFGPIKDIIESGVKDPVEAAKRAFEGTWFDIEPSLNGVLLAYARYRGITGASESEILDYMTKTLEKLSPGVLSEVQRVVDKAMGSDLPKHTKAAVAVALAGTVLENNDLVSSWFSYEATKAKRNQWQPEWMSTEEWAAHLKKWWEEELSGWGETSEEEEDWQTCGAYERPAAPGW